MKSIEILQTAVKRLGIRFPRLVMELNSLTFEASNDIPTIGVTDNYVCHFNEKFIEKIHAEMTVDFVLMHELSHIILDHHSRMRALVGKDATPEEENLVNMAGDFEINSMLSDSCAWGRFEFVPKDGCFPTREDYAPLHTVEYYWHLFEKQGNRPEPTQEILQNALDKFMASDGAKSSPLKMEKIREAQEAEKKAGMTQGQRLEDFEQKQKERQERKDNKKNLVSQVLDNAMDLPPNMYEWARTQILELGTWKKQLRSFAGDIIQGAENRTYAKPARREAIGNFVNPRVFTNSPEITVIVDVSGSMEILAKEAMSVLAEVLKAFKKITLVTCDSNVRQDQKLHNARDLANLTWEGGGTYLPAAIGHVESRKMPDGVIMITDAETPWPPKEFFRKTPFMVLLTRPIHGEAGGDDYNWARKIPKNAKVVDIPVKLPDEY